MNVLIKGMEMPKEGNETIIRILPDGTVLDQYGHHIGITATPIPPHGRLGDLNELESGLRHMAKYQDGERQQGILGCCETIRLTPTIIPASEEEE